MAAKTHSPSNPVEGGLQQPALAIGASTETTCEDTDARDRWAQAAARAKALREAREGRTRTGMQPVRAINEDDDGYDPYSDFHDQRTGEPLFQRDPWL